MEDAVQFEVEYDLEFQGWLVVAHLHGILAAAHRVPQTQVMAVENVGLLWILVRHKLLRELQLAYTN